MRIGMLATGAAFALAACSGGPDAPENTSANEVLPTQEVALSGVPERFLGTYDIDAGACAGAAGEMRLVIEPRTLRAHESISRIERAIAAPADAVDLDVVSTGEGITEQRRYRLALDDADRLVVTASGSESTRVRCAATADGPSSTASDPARVPVALSPDGLQLVDPSSGRTRAIAFGTPRAETLNAMRAGLGESSSSSTCSILPLADVRFGQAITLSFDDGRFAGWSVDPRGGRSLSTMSGVAIGSTRAEVEDSLTIAVNQTSLGTEFTAGGLSGLFSGTGAQARVEALWAGMTCIAR